MSIRGQKWSVGKTEEELKDAGKTIKSHTPDACFGQKSRKYGFGWVCKNFADKKTDEILGVHMIGARAADMIAEAVVAMEYRASSRRRCEGMSHAHPTFTEAIKEAALVRMIRHCISKKTFEAGILIIKLLIFKITKMKFNGMKKIVLFILTLPMLAFNPLQSKKDFIGKWTGEDKHKIGYISFDNEGYATFEIDGQVLGGKEFELNGEKGKMTYVVKYGCCASIEVI
ncbi:MAG: hypothetical protein R2783_01240 [Gelidibacter sp.]